MAKKFVKTDLNAFIKKDERPPAPYSRPNNDPPPRPKPRTTNQYQERTQTIQLRKYFQPVPASGELANLIQKFPSFFTQLCLNPESLRYRGVNDSYRDNFRNQRQAQQQEIEDWQSEGEVELGARINPQIAKLVTNIAPINAGELKPYQKEFLEEEMRKKLNAEEATQPEPPAKAPVAITNTKKQFAEGNESSSEEQVQIKKTVHVQQAPVFEQPQDYQHQFVDDDQDDNKFKQSSESDDDIFGGDSKGSDQESKQIPEPNSAPAVISHGRVQFADGQFSMFALTQGIASNQPIWGYSDGQAKYATNKTSKEMDQSYVAKYLKEYPLVSFDPRSNNFILYEIFHATPDIKFFERLTFNKMPTNGGINYKKKKPHNQSYSKSELPEKARKFSQQQQEDKPKGKAGISYKVKQPYI